MLELQFEFAAAPANFGGDEACDLRVARGYRRHDRAQLGAQLVRGARSALRRRGVCVIVPVIMGVRVVVPVVVGRVQFMPRAVSGGSLPHRWHRFQSFSQAHLSRTRRGQRVHRLRRPLLLAREGKIGKRVLRRFAGRARHSVRAVVWLAMFGAHIVRRPGLVPMLFETAIYRARGQ